MKNSNDSVIIQELSEFIERYNVINMYTTMFISLVGLVGNLFALVVLVYSRHKLPRIIGKNYLILLTLTNTIFLLIQFYVTTYNRMIYHFRLSRTFQLLDSNLVVCKLLPYLRYAFRLMNTMLTVCISVERLLAVFRPLQVRSLDVKCAYLFRLAILVSFVLPAYLLFLTELVPNTELDYNNIYTKMGIKKSFNFNSLTPLIGEHTCSIAKKNFALMLTFHILLFSLIFLCYLVIATSIFAIVLRLKRSQNFVFAYKSKAPVTIGSDQPHLMISKSATLKNNGDNLPSGGESSARELIDVVQTTPESTRNVEMTIASANNNCHNANNRKASDSSFISIDLVRRKNKMKYINNRIQNTKMLTSISISYVLLNLPYFLVMLGSMILSIRSSSSSSTMEEKGMISVADVAFRLKAIGYVLVTEIFQLVNFSVIGLLFFCSGKIFRLHAFKLCKINLVSKRLNRF